MYSTHGDIATDYEIRKRVTACAAQEGLTNPQAWTQSVIWNLVKSDWIAAWESAVAGGTIPEDELGRNEAVVTEGMILSSVQAALA